MANEKRMRQNFLGGLVDTVDLPAADTVVTDGVTTSGSPTTTSASAPYTSDQIGAPISGAGIPANTYIGVVNSATSIGLSSTQGSNTPVNATATATGVSITIGRSQNFHSAGLAAIATTIDTTSHMPITLDPDGLYGSPEVAYITALTSGNTYATLLRGQEGTTARLHYLDTPWVHGPTVRDVATGRVAKVIKTAGNYTINNLAWTTLDATLDLTVSAVAGDWLEIGLSAYVLPNATLGHWAFLDVATLVSSAAVTYVSSGTGTPAASGVPAWNIHGNLAEFGISGSVLLGPLTAGDIASGKVTVRLFFKNADANSATVRATAADPLQFWVRNLGPQEA